MSEMNLRRSHGPTRRYRPAQVNRRRRAAPPAPRDDDERPRGKRKSKGGSRLPWIIGGVLAALLLVVVGVVLALNFGSGTPSGPDTGDKNPPGDQLPAAVAWQYVPDAAKPITLTDAAMPLSEDPHGVLDIAFSDLSAAQAAVAFIGDKGEKGGLRRCGSIAST